MAEVKAVEIFHRRITYLEYLWYRRMYILFAIAIQVAFYVLKLINKWWICLIGFGVYMILTTISFYQTKPYVEEYRI